MNIRQEMHVKLPLIFLSGCTLKSVLSQSVSCSYIKGKNKGKGFSLILPASLWLPSGVSGQNQVSRR